MHFQSTYFAENIPELHRAYRSAGGSGKPIALLVTGWDHRYDESDIYRDTIRYFTERGEDISDQVYYPERRCCDMYAQVLREERTCVVVDAMIRVEDPKISRFSIRNLETTRDLVHDFITCIPTRDRWALPEIEELLDRIGFRVVLFEFERSPGQDRGGTGTLDAPGDMAGYRVPVAVTRAVWVGVVEPDDTPGQSVEGRLWDVLWMLHYAIATGPRFGSTITFQLYALIGGVSRLVTLKAVMGPGDEAEPVLTIMWPDED